MIDCARSPWAPSRVDPDQFGRSAPNVDHQQIMRLAADQRRTGNHRKLGLFLGFDDVQLKAGFALDAAMNSAPLRRGGTPRSRQDASGAPCCDAAFAGRSARPEWYVSSIRATIARSSQDPRQAARISRNCPRHENRCPWAGRSTCGNYLCPDQGPHKGRTIWAELARGSEPAVYRARPHLWDAVAPWFAPFITSCPQGSDVWVKEQAGNAESAVTIAQCKASARPLWSSQPS